jgi:hypothetical protein
MASQAIRGRYRIATAKSSEMDLSAWFFKPRLLELPRKARILQSRRFYKIRGSRYVCGHPFSRDPCGFDLWCRGLRLILIPAGFMDE